MTDTTPQEVDPAIVQAAESDEQIAELNARVAWLESRTKALNVEVRVRNQHIQDLLAEVQRLSLLVPEEESPEDEGCDHADCNEVD